MNEQIVYREFREEDRSALSQVVRETWGYDRFCSSKTSVALANVYLDTCLATQTYTQVALIDNVPVGIIMGRNPKEKKFRFKYVIKSSLSVLKLYSSSEGRKASKVFERVNEIDRELLNRCAEKYDGELDFFAIGKLSRGKGIGKALFMKNLDYMRSQGINNFYLFTNTTCNFGFYEHMGMERKQELFHSFDLNGEKLDITFYLYDYHF